MKRKILLGVFIFIPALFSVNIFAAQNLFAPKPLVASGSCPLVTSDTDSNFCSNFEVATICQCNTLSGTCTDMQTIYTDMVGFYGPNPDQAIDGACAFGAVMGWASQQACEDQWHCYINGGTDSKGGKCYGANGPGTFCQALTPAPSLLTHA